ncbi:hypothetical protein [Streptomyces sp. MS2.AVA.5]|uniref:Uncharacterized protein n=1 Tax=Streptomyces achmelvichensis TaxID=3134111 RepID=A0ACC6Q8T0_9ACTN
MTAAKTRKFDEAFFEDEFSAARKPTGSHRNRFDDPGSGTVYKSVSLPNPLDPLIAKVRQPEVIPPDHQGEKSPYWIFVPRAVAQKVATAKRERRPKPQINVTILWGVGGEIDAHGLRTVFEHAQSTVIINVTGREEGVTTLPDGTKVPTPAWGVGMGRLESVLGSLLDDEPDQVRKLLNTAGLEHAEPSVRILAAYSTGYRGMVQSINNNLLPLKDVARVVFFDCLYRADDPPLPARETPPKPLPDELNSGPDELIRGNHRNSPLNTRRALNKVLAAQPRADIIAYSVTTPGSPLYLHPSVADPVQHVAHVPLLMELREIPPFLKTVRPDRRDASIRLNRALRALLLTRYLRTGLRDDFFSESAVPKPYRDLFPVLPPRGQMASSETTGRIRGVKHLAIWQRENEARINATAKHVAAAQKLIADHHLVLPGTRGIGEELHRGFVGEFGWEFLL